MEQIKLKVEHGANKKVKSFVILVLSSIVLVPSFLLLGFAIMPSPGFESWVPSYTETMMTFILTLVVLILWLFLLIRFINQVYGKKVGVSSLIRTSTIVLILGISFILIISYLADPFLSLFN